MSNEKDTIYRQAAIDEVKRLHDAAWANWKETRILANTMIDALKDLPSVQPERKTFEEMSDTEFEKWLHEHGICNPDIHESIPCSAVPLLIDNAINELYAQPEIIRCKDCKHSEHWYRDKARCFLWHEEGIDVFEDGYCNYAGRKQDG